MKTKLEFAVPMHERSMCFENEVILLNQTLVNFLYSIDQTQRIVGATPCLTPMLKSGLHRQPRKSGESLVELLHWAHRRHPH